MHIKNLLKNNKNLLLLILLISFILRVWNLSYPQTYVFDEVYYPYTAQQYVKGNIDAWDFSKAAPKGHAYAWVNPPLAQEIMALSILVLGDKHFAWRFPGVILGTLSILLVFLIGKKLFSEKVGLISALLFSLDGLNFVQSRIAMLDIYLVFFTLTSLTLLLYKKFFWSAVFFGAALSTKWTAVYLFPLIFLILLKDKNFLKLIYFILIPPIIYLSAYIPFFLNGFNFQYFYETLKQEWWYHTNLKATHDYSSPAWSWPLNLYPVWYFVEYHPNNFMSNIFASGNPILYWIGTGSLLVTLWDFWRTKTKSLFIILAGFLFFWLPWSFSPRIMFLYYFAPAVPFMCLITGYQLGQLKSPSEQKYLKFILTLIILGFLIVYPVLIGFPLPKNIFEYFFTFNFAKNPF